jgi:hypothetical protein
MNHGDVDQHYYGHVLRDVIYPYCWKCHASLSKAEQKALIVMLRAGGGRRVEWISRQLIVNLTQ